MGRGKPEERSTRIESKLRAACAAVWLTDRGEKERGGNRRKSTLEVSLPPALYWPKCES